MDGAPKDTRETKAVMGAIEKERGLRDMQEVSVCWEPAPQYQYPPLLIRARLHWAVPAAGEDADRPESLPAGADALEAECAPFRRPARAQKEPGSDDRCACCQS